MDRLSKSLSLGEKGSNMGLFLVRIFLYSELFGAKKCGVVIMERGKIIRTDGIRLPDGQDLKDIYETGYTF